MSKAASKTRRARWHVCNIVAAHGTAQRLWQFSGSGNATTPLIEQTRPNPQPFPAKLVSKDWRHLVRPKLNIAWLPADQVFLRVVELPQCEPAELLAMVELQLEKLSPLPVNQIVWSVEPLSKPGEESQTVIVLIVARALVEQYLGNLEGQGYLADRLEIPWLHPLAATPATGDEVWLYAQAQPDKTVCLGAWFVAGKLRTLNLYILPAAPEAVKQLTRQLTQVAWAAEVEGWMTGGPAWRLVADPQTAAVWEPALRDWTGRPIDVRPAPSLTELAALNAQRATRGVSRANLLPSEYATRYRQQFVDGLWMRGLGGIVALYLVGLLVYLSAVQWLNFQLDGLKNEVRNLAGHYTNALQLKTRIEIAQETRDLKTAALDSYQVAVETLPEGLQLLSLFFQRGEKLVLAGTAPTAEAQKVTEYVDALSKASLLGSNGPPLFSKVDPPRIQGGAGGQPFRWDFACTLNRKETP